MCIVDIPAHDMSSDFVVMAERRMAEAKAARELEVRGGPRVWRHLTYKELDI